MDQEEVDQGGGRSTGGGYWIWRRRIFYYNTVHPLYARFVYTVYTTPTQKDGQKKHISILYYEKTTSKINIYQIKKNVTPFSEWYKETENLPWV